MKVYVVTEGFYSDYHIETVFTDKSQAKLYCATHENEEIRIEEYETEECKLTSERPILKCWSVPFWGTNLSFERMYFHYTFTDRKKVVGNRYGLEKVVYTMPEDRTEPEAKKAISDFYAQWKAEQQGL